MKIKIKRGDTVVVTAGKEKGKTGAVVRVIADANRVTVDGVNTYKKFVRAPRTRRDGGATQQVDRLRAMDVSNVALVCPACKKPTRVGYVVDADTKSRVCRKCGATI